MFMFRATLNEVFVLIFFKCIWCIIGQLIPYKILCETLSTQWLYSIRLKCRSLHNLTVYNLGLVPQVQEVWGEISVTERDWGWIVVQSDARYLPTLTCFLFIQQIPSAGSGAKMSRDSHCSMQCPFGGTENLEAKRVVVIIFY